MRDLFRTRDHIIFSFYRDFNRSTISERMKYSSKNFRFHEKIERMKKMTNCEKTNFSMSKLEIRSSFIACESAVNWRFEGCTGRASYIIPSDITRGNKKNGLFIMTPAIVKKGLSRILHEGCLIHQLHSSTSAASVSFISLKPNTVLVYVHDAKV